MDKGQVLVIGVAVEEATMLSRRGPRSGRDWLNLLARHFSPKLHGDQLRGIQWAMLVAPRIISQSQPRRPSAADRLECKPCIVGMAALQLLCLAAAWALACVAIIPLVVVRRAISYAATASSSGGRADGA